MKGGRIFHKCLLPLITCLIFSTVLYASENAETTGNDELTYTKVVISQLLENSKKFHLQPVEVVGIVSSVKNKTSKRGNPYCVFTIEDEDAYFVKVFTWGHQKLKIGDRVRVKGIFHRVKRVGKYKFRNEIEAEEVEKIEANPVKEKAE